jgi:DNA-binding Lrp family transcriptional regulator
VTKYRVGRVSRETQEMDERIRAVVERNGGPAPVTIRYVEPRSNGNGNGQATHDQSSANGDRKHVTKDEVARAIAGLPSDFTCGDVAGAVGLSQSAAKQHVQRLAQDGVVEKTGAVRENGAHVWRLRDRGSKPGANDGAESPTDADSDSAPAAAEDTRFPSVPVGSGRQETQNPVTGMSEQDEPAERLISLPEPEPAADPLALALTELARRRQVLEAAEQALTAVARL